jgi:hypothetical protein
MRHLVTTLRPLPAATRSFVASDRVGNAEQSAGAQGTASGALLEIGYKIPWLP